MPAATTTKATPRMAHSSPSLSFLLLFPALAPPVLRKVVIDAAKEDGTVIKIVSYSVPTRPGWCRMMFRQARVLFSRLGEGSKQRGFSAVFPLLQTQRILITVYIRVRVAVEILLQWLCPLVTSCRRRGGGFCFLRSSAVSSSTSVGLLAGPLLK